MKTCPKCGDKHGKNGVYCSRTCANSRTWTEEDKKKKSVSVTKKWAEIGHPSKGKPGWKPTEDDKELKRQRTLEAWDKKGRFPPEHHAAKNRRTVARYRARKINALPKDADLFLLKLIYKYVPDGYEVDHIIPLSKGGLEQPSNLQYLTSLENKQKSNKLDYITESHRRWQDNDKLLREYYSAKPEHGAWA